MQRHAYAAKIRSGMIHDFHKVFKDRWPLIRALLDQKHVNNFSIWIAEDLVFAYGETLMHIDLYPAFDGIAYAFRGICDPLSASDRPMRLMYEDIGIVRESKEHIRHRVFMTKLVSGAEDEYKRRHDELAASREGISPGPDSNFTIWSAGGYIFGYDEIDTTMEHEMTEEERASTIAWETRMLEIMSWITDDVDWITGESHPHVKQLAAFDYELSTQ